MKLVFAARGLPICDYEVVLKRDWQRDERAIMNTIVDEARLPGLREAGEPRIERRHLEGEARDRAAGGDASRRGVRSQDRHRGGGARSARDRVRRARQRRARGVGAGRDRPVARVLRLRGEVHRRGIEAADSRAARRTRRREEVRTLAIAAYKAIDCAGMARVDFLLAGDSGVAVPERAEHDSRIHDDQHVLEDVGGERRRPIPRCSIVSSRSPSSATPRSSSCGRACDEVRHGSSALRGRLPSDRRCTAARGAGARAGCTGSRAALTEAPRLAADLRHDPRRPLRPGRGPAEAGLSAGSRRRLPGAPRRVALVADSDQPGKPARSIDRFTELAASTIAANEAWTRREPQRAEAWFYLAGAYAPRVQWRVLRGERLGAARDGNTIRDALERALQLDPTLNDAYFGIGLYHYYADVAPAAAKILRWLLFLPGGDRVMGLREMLQARDKGELLERRSRLPAAHRVSLVRTENRGGARPCSSGSMPATRTTRCSSSGSPKSRSVYLHDHARRALACAGAALLDDDARVRRASVRAARSCRTRARRDRSSIVERAPRRARDARRRGDRANFF